MRISAALPFILALQLPLARQLAAQAAPAPDISGVWVINLAKSNFGNVPRPTIDSSKVTRAGSVYQIDATSDFGGQGTQHYAYTWPVGDGEATNDLPGGARMHSTVKLNHDTATFSSVISLEGQTVALQTGREYRSPDGNTLTREVNIQPVPGPSPEPLHMVLVYDKR